MAAAENCFYPCFYPPLCSFDLRQGPGRRSAVNSIACAMSPAPCISHAILIQQQANSLQQLFHLHIALPLVGFICFMHPLQLPCLAVHVCLLITSLLSGKSHTLTGGFFIMQILLLVIALLQRKDLCCILPF